MASTQLQDTDPVVHARALAPVADRSAPSRPSPAALRHPDGDALFRARQAPCEAVLGRIGNLELRLAVSQSDLECAQRLRYQVFYEEMAAQPDPRTLLTRRDSDAFDALCDHLLVLDHAGAGAAQVVGTYRLLRQEVAAQHGGFYTSGEYDIAPLLAAHPDMRVLELGRSCVLAPYRNKRTVELLWHGIWAYVLHHRIDVMLGCASLPGADPDKLSLPLSFLHHHALAPEEWRARAWEHLHVPMDRLPQELVDVKAALAALPPLIKGYLRLGAGFGDGAVVDRQFGTTDVLVVLPVSRISPRYIAHFGADAGRHG
jgi:putative hemolysin